MDAWGKTVGAGDKVLMLADGNGQFAKALGVELDLVDKGLGVRSRRFAMLGDDQVRGGLGFRGLGFRVEGAGIPGGMRMGVSRGVWGWGKGLRGQQTR